MYKLLTKILLLAIMASIAVGVLGAEEAEKHGSADSAAQPAWILADHDLTEKSSLEDINTILTRGYQVVGIDSSDTRNTLSVLYLKSDDPARIWSLYLFERLDNFENEFTAFIQKQWVPIDIAKTEDGLYVYFVKDSTLTPASWRMSIASNAEEIEKIRETLAKANFHITGMSQSTAKDFWLLSLQNNPPAQHLLRGFKRDELTGNIEAALKDTYSIDSIIRIDDVIFIQFIK